MMKVLVTGGTGFIGSYIVEELLNNGYNVSIISRRDLNGWNKRIEIIKGDITKPETISDAFKDVDIVIHNAAYSRDHGKKRVIYSVNVGGTKNVADACVRNNIDRLIYMSSAGVYGFPKTRKPINEDFPTRPMNAYQRSKLLGEKVLKEYKEIKTSIIRPPLVLGARGYTTKILLDNVSKGLKLIGKGDNMISIVHPADVARCSRLVLERDNKGEVFNVVSFTVRMRDFLDKLADRLKVDKPKKRIPFLIAYLTAILCEHLSSDPQITRFRVMTLRSNRIISCDKARKELGYRPTFDLEKTLDDMVEWYRSIR